MTYILYNYGNVFLSVYYNSPIAAPVFFCIYHSVQPIPDPVSLFSAGFAVISPSALYFDLQVLWLILMYVSAYPMTITMRNSNVYEERSLGIYAGDEPANNPNTCLFTTTGVNHNPTPMTPMSTVSQASHLSRRSVEKLANIGRQGTALLGRQLQRRMTGFQGVGVTAPRIHISDASITDTHSIKTTRTITAADPEVDLVSQHVRSQLSHDLGSTR